VLSAIKLASAELVFRSFTKTAASAAEAGASVPSPADIDSKAGAVLEGVDEELLPLFGPRA